MRISIGRGSISALIATVVLSACAAGSPRPSSAPPSAATAAPTVNPLASVEHPMDDLRAARLIAEIRTGGHPDWQVFSDGSLWVSTGIVVRIDVATNAVVATIPVRGPCFGLTAGFGSVWSPACDTNSVDRIDPATNKVIASIPVAGIPSEGEGLLVAALGSVWLFTDDHGTLARIDPAANTVANTYQLGDDPIALAATDQALWATEPGHDAVLQIDGQGKLVRTIAVGRQPRFIAAGDGAVWVLGQGDGDVTRIDPTTGKVVATIQARVPGRGGCIAAGGGAVWVTMPETPLSRIDASSNSVVEQFQGPGGDCISFADGSVWLSNNEMGNVWRIKP
jgi:DNA-binding beta-propeller fold protein YncE